MEELERFETRYENGYDIFTDAKYVAWLHKYHPDSAPSISSLFASVTPLESTEPSSDITMSSPAPAVSPSPPAVGPSPPAVSPSPPAVSPSPPAVSPSPPAVSTSPPAGSPPIPAVRTSAVSPPTPATPVASNQSTPTSRSPLSELLVLPNCTPKRKKTDPPKSSRILTSRQSLELLQLKEEKKKKEQEEKERKKAEREKKKLEREQEKARKQEEREAKKAEKQRKVEEKEKQKGTAGKRGRGASTFKNHVNQYKAPSSSSSSTSTKQYPKRRALVADGQPQSRKVSGDTCAVCCGTYVDDVDDITGEVTADWIQCTDDCAAWSHVDCLEEDAGGVICALCSNVTLLYQPHAFICNTGNTCSIQKNFDFF